MATPTPLIPPTANQSLVVWQNTPSMALANMPVRLPAASIDELDTGALEAPASQTATVAVTGAPAPEAPREPGVDPTTNSSLRHPPPTLPSKGHRRPIMPGNA
jgi:hypothetical protein